MSESEAMQREADGRAHRVAEAAVVAARLFVFSRNSEQLRDGAKHSDLNDAAIAFYRAVDAYEEIKERQMKEDTL